VVRMPEYLYKGKKYATRPDAESAKTSDPGGSIEVDMGPANDSRLSGELERAKRERSGQRDREIIARGAADAAAGAEPPTAGITPGLGEIAKRAREKRAADAAAAEAATDAAKKKALEESAREGTKAKK
jgi:hypothetical protein